MSRHCIFITCGWLICIFLIVNSSSGNQHATKLFLDLMSGYNKLVRPVLNSSDKVIVHVKLKLSQLLDVAEKTQIMTTNIWLKQSWMDINLKWNLSEYGGVDVMYIPSELIWIPDIVLYNNADGKYQGSLMNKAAVHANGTVVWEPPAIYKSMCPIEIEFFPFDTQDCEMRFGSWTYDGFEVDLVHFDQHKVKHLLDAHGKSEWLVVDGVDLSDFYPSAEFDIMEVPARRHEQYFNCCTAPYIDITYTIRLRRQTLFYTVHLVVPCVGLAFLCILVFYLPSACGEKVALSISILICLTMFFLLLVEIIPSTSLKIPLIGKYLLFTMVMVTLSIAVTVVQLNFHYRSPNTHHLSPFMRKLFLDILPKFLMMRRPAKDEIDSELKNSTSTSKKHKKKQKKSPEFFGASVFGKSTNIGEFNADSTSDLAPALVALPAAKQFQGLRAQTEPKRELKEPVPFAYRTNEPSPKPFVPPDPLMEDDAFATHNAVRSACFIADYLKRQTEDDEVKEDWQFIAHVLDRLFLWIFSIACLGGTLAILLNPKSSVFDRTQPII